MSNQFDPPDEWSEPGTRLCSTSTASCLPARQPLTRLLLVSVCTIAFALTLTAAHAQQLTIKAHQHAPTASALQLKPASHEVKQAPASGNAPKSSFGSSGAQDAAAKTIPWVPEQFKSVLATGGAAATESFAMLRPEAGSAVLQVPGGGAVKQAPAATPGQRSSAISSTAQEAAAKAIPWLPEQLESMLSIPRQCVRSLNDVAAVFSSSPSEWNGNSKLC